MVDQQSFASLAWIRTGKVACQEQFLAEIDAAIPRQLLVDLIEPHDATGETVSPPQGLERMLRSYFLQQWFNLSELQAEDAIFDSKSMRQFAKVNLSFDQEVPGETTILHLRHLLEKHRLTQKIFEAVTYLVEERRLFLHSDTIMDATIVAAPSSTKNESKARAPEMKQTQKGRNWQVGMKFNIGTDRLGTVHSLTATYAAVPDLHELPKHLHGEETVLCGGQAYWERSDQEAFEAQGVRCRVDRRGPQCNKSLTAHQRWINRTRSRTRARCEYPFRVVKHLWGFTKKRYRGIETNLARRYPIFALANQYALRHQLMPRRWNYAL